MNTAVFKTILVGALLSLSTQAHAVTSHKISIDDFPYVGSLADSAENVDTFLVQQAGTLCGSLDNVAGLSDVTLVMEKTSVPNVGVNPNGTPGGKAHNAVFVFSYPHVTGSAVATCLK